MRPPRRKCTQNTRGGYSEDTEIRAPDNGGYARASYASGGSGASRVPRIAGDVTADSALVSCVLVGYVPGAERRRFLICSGAASRRGLPCGGSTRFYGGSTRWQGHRGRFYGAAAAVRGLASSSGRLSLCFPDDEASCCGWRGPALPAARSRLTALVVSAGHKPGPVGQAGAADSFRLPMRPRPALAVLAWGGDGSPVWGCITTLGDQVPPRTPKPGKFPAKQADRNAHLISMIAGSEQ